MKRVRWNSARAVVVAAAVDTAAVAVVVAVETVAIVVAVVVVAAETVAIAAAVTNRNPNFKKTGPRNWAGFFVDQSLGLIRPISSRMHAMREE